MRPGHSVPGELPAHRRWRTAMLRNALSSPRGGACTIPQAHAFAHPCLCIQELKKPDGKLVMCRCWCAPPACCAGGGGGTNLIRDGPACPNVLGRKLRLNSSRGKTLLDSTHPTHHTEDGHYAYLFGSRSITFVSECITSCAGEIDRVLSTPI